MRNDLDIKNLASVVQYWLSYWDTISRASMLQENSLRYAISEIIERRFNGVCLLELPHPRFTSKNIDVIWADYNEQDNILDEFCKKGVDRKSKQTLKKKLNDLYQKCDIIECKIASGYTNSSYEKQRIFNDLCRLYFYKKQYPNRQAYFLMSGIQDYFDAVRINEILGNYDTTMNDAKENTSKQELKNDEVAKYLDQNALDDSIESVPPMIENNQERIYNTELLPASVRQKNTTDTKTNIDSKDEVPYTQWLSFNDKSKDISLNFDYTSNSYYANFYDQYNENKRSTAKKKDDNNKILTEEEKYIRFSTKLVALNIAGKEEMTAHSVAIWEIIL